MGKNEDDEMVNKVIETLEADRIDRERKTKEDFNKAFDTIKALPHKEWKLAPIAILSLNLYSKAEFCLREAKRLIKKSLEYSSLKNDYETVRAFREIKQQLRNIKKAIRNAEDDDYKNAVTEEQ